MLRIIESVELNYDVKPLEGHTFEEILHLLQVGEAQTLIDPLTAEKGVYLATPKQKPGVKKIASMVPLKDRKRTLTYGRD